MSRRDAMALAFAAAAVLALATWWEPEIVLPPTGHGASAYAVGGPRR